MSLFVCVCVCLSVRKTLGQNISTSLNPIHKLFHFSERRDNVFFVFWKFWFGAPGEPVKNYPFWRLKSYFSMKELSDWVENIQLVQFEYGEFKNEISRKKYWRLPDKLFIKLSYTNLGGLSLGRISQRVLIQFTKFLIFLKEGIIL